MVRPRELQLVEEDLRELVVVVLTGVDQHLVGHRPQPIRHRRRLHELRPVAYDGEYAHESGVHLSRHVDHPRQRRGTVQGVLAGVGHVLWYVDWHTGGQGRRGPR